MEFLDLFLPINLSSSSRARVFLWLMYHYLQGPDKPNPFDDDYSRANPPKVPRMRSLTREEQAQEKVTAGRNIVPRVHPRPTAQPLTPPLLRSLGSLAPLWEGPRTARR